MRGGERVVTEVRKCEPYGSPNAHPNYGNDFSSNECLYMMLETALGFVQLLPRLVFAREKGAPSFLYNIGWMPLRTVNILSDPCDDSWTAVFWQ